MSFTMFDHPRTLILKRSISMTIYPTVLYIKQHPVTGMKYFGKTTKDPYKYHGSGKYWSRILKKYGKDHIITLWVSDPYTDSIAISEYALIFSRDNNIVESKDWANQRPENGLDGGGNKGIPHTNATKKKVSEANTGKTPWNKGIPCSDKTKQKISDSKIGKPQSPESNQKRSESTKGVPKGSPSEETKQKMRKPKRKVECPHCGKIGGSNTMQRWHFDNCKKRNNHTSIIQ